MGHEELDVTSWCRAGKVQEEEAQVAGRLQKWQGVKQRMWRC